jgi:hypothetical protein
VLKNDNNGREAMKTEITWQEAANIRGVFFFRALTRSLIALAENRDIERKGETEKK